MIEQNKIDEARKALKVAAKMSETYYKKPIVICYSGGKDSDVLLHLAKTTLEKQQFKVLHGITTVDSPITNKHINEVYKQLEEEGICTEKSVPMVKNKETGQMEKTNMWKLIIENKMPPTRIARYCCRVLKETTTPNQIAAVGVREEESAGRKGRDIFIIRGNSKKEFLYYSVEHAEEVFNEAQEMDEVWDCQLITKAKANNDLIVSPIYNWKESEIWEYAIDNKIKMNPMYKM